MWDGGEIAKLFRISPEGGSVTLGLALISKFCLIEVVYWESREGNVRHLIQIGLLLLSTVGAAKAEESSPAGTMFAEPLYLNNQAIFTSLAMIAFGLMVIIIQFIVILRHKELFSSENILAIFTVPLIIVGTLIIVTGGYTPQILAPILGFFGTVVGYLIGNKDRAGRTRPRKADEKPPPPPP
jgi:energy-converting hydrogenase Eha subunit A